MTTQTTPQTDPPAETSRRYRVLIVDDDEHLIGTLRLWFERHNIHVVSAADGHEAFQMLREADRMDVVLTDFMMPNLNGIEFLRLIKSNPKLFDTKVVVMSNNSSFEFRKRAIEIGAADYVMKEIGARSIVEIAMRVGGLEAKPAPRTSSPAGGDGCLARRLQTIAILSSGMLDLLQVARQVQPMPPAAITALEAVDRIARQISEAAVETDG